MRGRLRGEGGDRLAWWLPPALQASIISSRPTSLLIRDAWGPSESMRSARRRRCSSPPRPAALDNAPPPSSERSPKASPTAAVTLHPLAARAGAPGATEAARGEKGREAAGETRRGVVFPDLGFHTRAQGRWREPAPCLHPTNGPRTKPVPFIIDRRKSGRSEKRMYNIQRLV
jgi:hypothetical protein